MNKNYRSRCNFAKLQTKIEKTKKNNYLCSPKSGLTTKQVKYNHGKESIIDDSGRLGRGPQGSQQRDL